jgi:GxxExxY protein
VSLLLLTLVIEKHKNMEKEKYEYLANQVFNSALEVHKLLQPGLLESVYVYCLVEELKIRGIRVATNVKVPLYYKNRDTGKDFYIDILVEDEIVIEVKSCEGGIHPLHEAQILSYLKLANKKLGFLINFNVLLIKDGFRRKVNNY